MFPNHTNVLVLSPGPSGITALALPLQSHSSNFGNPVELTVDESVRLTAHWPGSADCLNVPISPADDVITTVRTPIQSHNVNLQNAMHGQMIDSSSQMDHAVNEHVIPSKPPYASSSSFPSSSTLPHPEANHVKEDFKSSALDDSWDFCLSSIQSLPDDGMSFQIPQCDEGSVQGASKGVNLVLSDDMSSEPPYASSSSFPSSSTLPPPEGNCVKEDFKSSASDNSWDFCVSLIQSLLDDDMSVQIPPCNNGSVRGSRKGVIGWLKIKAVLRWGFFIRKRRVSIVQLDEPPIEVQA